MSVTSRNAPKIRPASPDSDARRHADEVRRIRRANRRRLRRMRFVSA